MSPTDIPEQSVTVYPGEGVLPSFPTCEYRGISIKQKIWHRRTGNHGHLQINREIHLPQTTDSLTEESGVFVGICRQYQVIQSNSVFCG